MSIHIDLARLFLPQSGQVRLQGEGFSRTVQQDGLEVLLDSFPRDGMQCAFLRLTPSEGEAAELSCQGAYSMETAAAGGWLLLPRVDDLPAYWLPQVPMQRKLDRDGHILAHGPARVTGLDVSPAALAVTLDAAPERSLDLVVWRLPPGEPRWVEALQQFMPIELQRYFLWSSHTLYTRPADLYLHLVHGHVYENHEVWPKYWRVCSELDAYALYVTLTGLLRASGKRLYDLLRTQVVFSVIARQAEDGGWYHGEWSDHMESHYRLHAGAMHLLAAWCEETADPAAARSLQRAAAFAAQRTDRLSTGMWYLHDSLEADAEGIRRYPFRVEPSRALGKSPNNLLVLNTHLDTNIAMERQRRVSGDARHGELIASAAATTRAVLALRPAEWLYRLLYRALGLTFLPTEQAQNLPLLQRAIKRLAWKYLAKYLPRIKARFPRLVMPGGYIERDLVQYGPSVRYQPVNLMDLVRTRRLFDDPGMDQLLRQSFAYTRSSGLTRRWKETRGKEDDSLGFWAEALYHLCLAIPDLEYRAWLAEAMLDLEDNRLGMSPSLLGGNAEAVPVKLQQPCLSPVDARLRVANLCVDGRNEWLVVNPGNQAIALSWETVPAANLVWYGSDGRNVAVALPTISPRGWMLGTASG